MKTPKRTRPINEIRETPAWYIPVTDKSLEEITRRIVMACQPERIILFGSYAHGKPDHQSDLDLLVITRRDARTSVFARARKIYALFLDRAFPMDILVRSPQEISHRQKIGDMFIQDILEHGRVLYERGNSSRMGAQSRRRLGKRAHLGTATENVSA